MKLTHPIHRPATAFTLIEVLLAVGVFAIVLASINTVYFSALRLRNKTTAMIEDALPMQQAVAIIKRDLAGLQPAIGGKLNGNFQNTEEDAEDLESGGRKVSPALFTNSGLPEQDMPWSEVQKVAYFLLPPTNDISGFNFVRKVTRNLITDLTQTPVQQVLLSGVDNVQFLYYDGSDWAEIWDSTAQTNYLNNGNMPLGIKVLINMYQEKADSTKPPAVEFVVPVLVQGTNELNQPSTGGGQ
jgi:type II secretion system protein J